MAFLYRLLFAWLVAVVQIQQSVLAVPTMSEKRQAAGVPSFVLDYGKIDNMEFISFLR